MLIVCAWCNKMGKKSPHHAWEPMVVKDQSHASHGMCPSCFKKEVELVCKPVPSTDLIGVSA